MSAKKTNSKEKKVQKYNGIAPLLFSVPLSDYSDEMEKKRNRKLYLKLKAIENELKSTKEVLDSILAKHQERMNMCRQLICVCREVNESSYTLKNYQG